jgi:hypothetical protein
MKKLSVFSKNRGVTLIGEVLIIPRLGQFLLAQTFLNRKRT